MPASQASLGDGVYSLTGEHRGTSLLAINKDTVAYGYPESKALGIATGDYSLEIIESYNDIKNHLNFRTNLLLATSFISLDSNAEFLRDIKLNQNEVFILITWKAINNTAKIVQTIFKDGVDKDLILQDVATFVAAHGDRYITEIKYGKILYALIKYKSLDQEKIVEFKQQLNLALQQIKNFTGSEKAYFKFHKKYKLLVANIKLHIAGAQVDLPSIGSDLIRLIKFIDRFYKSDILPLTPIEYITEPHVTAFQNEASAKLERSLLITKSLQGEADARLNHSKVLITGIESSLTIPEVAVERIHVLNGLLQQSKTIEQNLKDIIRKLNSLVLTWDLSIESRNEQDQWRNQIRQHSIPLKEIEEKFIMHNYSNMEVARVYSLSRNYYFKIANISSKFFTLNFPQGKIPKSLTWYVDPLTNCDYKNITFDIKLKRKSRIRCGTYNLFKHLSGIGSKTKTSGLTKNSKLVIANPKGTKHPFWIVVEATSAIKLEDKSVQNFENQAIFGSQMLSGAYMDTFFNKRTNDHKDQLEEKKNSSSSQSIFNS